MAKITTTAAVLLCLFAAALALSEPTTDDASTVIALPIPEVNTKSTEVVNGETKSNSEITKIAMPLITYRFNPINRRFRFRSKYPCHHHHHTERREISYGNDMLVSNPRENTELENHEIVRGERKWWPKLHHRHHEEESDSDSDSDDEGEDNSKIKEAFPYHHHRHHHHRRREEKKGGFMKLVSNFVHNHF